MILTSPAHVERVRSISFAILTLTTIVVLLGNVIVDPLDSNLVCSVTTNNLDAVLTIGLWVLALAASLGALSATHHQLQPQETYKRVLVWVVYLASVPALFILPSSMSINAAASACTTSNFFTYLSWYMMGVIAAAALCCIHLLVHGVRHHETQARQNATKAADSHKKQLVDSKENNNQLSQAIKQLRNPTEALRAQIDALASNSNSNSTEEAAVALEQINNSARAMALTIETHLDLTKVESGSIDMQLIDLNLRDTVEHICDEMRPNILKRGLILLMRTNLQSQSIVHADRQKLQQIITTLIDQANNTTNRGTITAFVRDEVKEEKVYVDVIDTGVGMTAYDSKTIFKKYADTDSRDNTCSPNLKLCLAQKLAETMGGTITAHSEGKGKGSRFTLELPLAM